MGKQIWYKPVEPKNFGSDVSVRPYRLWGWVRGGAKEIWKEPGDFRLDFQVLLSVQ